MREIGVTVCVVAAIVPLLLWWAFTAATLWAWFFVPLGLPEITTPHALGIMITFSAFRARYAKKKADWPEGEALKALGMSIAGPALALGIGWIAWSVM